MKMNENTISVDNIHKLNYELHGNPKGNTILFVHGGPGLGVKKTDLNFFDLSKQNVILFDQRGCGKSIPKGELNSNTTEHLINDMDKILKKLNKKEVFLFGGSWGSTLSLLYAMKYPKKVKGLIIRGLFTATKREREHFELGGTKIKFREEWNRFISFVPSKYLENPSQYYFNQVLTGDMKTKSMYSFELIRYGNSVAGKKKQPDIIDAELKKNDYLSQAKILSHYSINNFFLPDNFIEDNMIKIKQIPIKLLHGIHDQITLFSTAQNFSKMYENIELISVDAGHSSSDELMKKALVKTVKEFVI